MSWNEIGTDGTNIFSLSYLNLANTNAGIEQLRTKLSQKQNFRNSFSNSWNQAVAEVYEASAPRADYTFAAPLWLAYASHKYLKTATNGRLPKVWLDGRHFSTNTVKAAWSQLSANPGLPSHVTYYNEGTQYVETPQGAIKTMPNQAPFNEGYLQGRYDTLSTTNFNGMVLPTSFKFVRYTPATRATNVGQLRISSTVTGKITTLGSPNGETRFLPTITKATAVQDSRPQWRTTDYPGGISYSTSNHWYAEVELQRAWQYRHDQQSKTRDSSMRVLTLYSVFLLITATALVIAWRHVRKAD